MLVQTGERVGIGGFIVSQTAPKHVLLRGVGPSLKQSGISNALADPVLELYDSNGVQLTANDNWKDGGQEAVIRASGIPPSNDLESAIDRTLLPGTYTAILKGKNNTAGVALIEVYDLSRDVNSRLVNISTRAFVETGSNIVIAGFVLGNDSGKDRVVLRGLGPSLEDSGVSDVLADPHLELRNSQGALLLANDDWQDNASQAAELRDADFNPKHDYESGIVAVLPPGDYTALLTGLKTGTGVGLVEVYDLGAPPAPTRVHADVTHKQKGTWSQTEQQHVRFPSPQFSGTFRISVYKPSIINESDIGSRAALQGQTASIPYTASAKEISDAIKAIPNSYYAYGQFGNLELDRGSFSYFASVGAINRDPIVTLDPGGTASSGFTIEFGSLVGTDRRYNPWVANMPCVTIEAP
jgi:hypothetical protein